MNTIKKWLDVVDVDGEFKGEFFYVRGRKKKDKLVENEEPQFDEVDKEFEEKIKNAPSGTKMFSLVEETEKKDEEIELEEDEKEWMKMEENVAAPVKLNYDENDDFSIYSPDDYIQYYETYCERKFGDDGNKKGEYLSKLTNLWGNPYEMGKEIAKKKGVSESDFQSFVNRNFIEGENGLQKKNELVSALRELKNKILNAPFDTSWLPVKNEITVHCHGHNLIGLAYKTCKWMSRI